MPSTPDDYFDQLFETMRGSSSPDVEYDMEDDVDSSEEDSYEDVDLY